MQRTSFPLSAVAALLVLFVPPTPGKASQPAEPAKLWACKGSAKGERGAEVSATWLVRADGAVDARGARWKPPHDHATATSDRRQGAMDNPSPSLSISYDHSEMGAIGRVQEVYVDVEGRSGRWVRQAGSVTLMLDGGAEWTVPLDEWQPRFAKPARFLGTLAREDVNPDLLAVVATASDGLVRLDAKDGARMSESRFDLGARSERDRLYEVAWAIAERASQRPNLCVEAVLAPVVPAPDYPAHD